MSKKEFKIILGSWPNGNDGITEPFNNDKINFLDQISKEILKNKRLNMYPDLKDFGFWCRKKNIYRYKNSIKFNNNLLGRGIALHIPPSNVPMNLAFTMAIGIISGCENFIRLPEKEFPQIISLMKIIRKIISTKKYTKIRKSFCIIKYEKSDFKSSLLSKISDVRLIWGGDLTVKKFKEFQTKTKNIDLYFPNKVSGSLINVKELKKLKKDEFVRLVYKFFVDSYLMDQKGCSSPKILFWDGKDLNLEKKFYHNLKLFVKKRYQLSFSRSNDKFFLLNDLSIKSSLKVKTNFDNLNLITIKINRPPSYESYSNLAYGMFYTANLKNLENLKLYINDNFQTLSYFGYNKKELINFIVKKKLRGIDRVMPIGSAFEMNIFWDGYDLIKHMTRSIS